MEVYIEYVVLDNLIINYVLLELTNKSVKLNAKKRYCFLSSMLGTVVSIFMPFLNINVAPFVNNVLLVCLKLCLGLIMCLLIKKLKCFTQFITTFFLFLTYTFVLGGMCFGLIYFLNLKTTFSGLIIYGFEIPISLFILLGLFYLKILLFLINYIKHKNSYSNFYFDVKLKNNRNSVRVTGFLDSGNQIQVDDFGLTVINYKTLLKLYPSLNVKSLIMGNLEECELTNAKFVNMVNSGGKSKMLTFDVEELEITDDKNKVVTLKNQKLGLAKTNFGGKFDCLLSLELFN